MSLYSQRVAQDNPVLYFENNSSGVNNTGSRTPTISTGTSNVFYSTGGVANSPYIYVGDYNDSNYGFEYSDSTTTFNDKAFSITGWFKVSASDNQQAFNWIFHTGTSGNGINIDVNQSLAYLSATPNGFTNQVSSPGVSLNAWHHFAWTVDSTNMKLYIDGSLVSTASTPSTISMDSQVKYWMRWTSSGTTRYGATGNYDELAVFDSTLSATTIAEHYAAGFAIGYSATPATASALAVQPTTIIDSGYVAQAATASATFAEASWNFVNLPQMLDTYMQTLSFEQWYRFDQPKKIRNYGTGGNAETAWAFNGSATTDILGGRQGSGALVIYGQQGNTVPLAFGVNQPYSTEITDNEFAIGFWFKAESGFGDKLADIIKYYNPFGSDYYNLRIRNTGYVEWTMQGNQQNQVVHLTNVADGNWHFIHARASTSGNTISINVDNGTAVSTTTNGTWPSVSALTFGNVLNSGTNNKKGYISHYWVNGYSTITSTQIGNMITYAGTPIQAATILPEPTVKFTNAYNDYIQANGSTIEFRMDEATGTPVNFGTIDSLSIGLNGSNVSYLQPTVNRYAYKFTNANTYLQGDWTAASGTFSTNAQQTMVVRFKSNGYKSFEQILGSTGMFGFLGTGITIALGANNGHISARLNKGFGPTDTETITWSTNVADNEWHLAVACKSGSNFTLYVDGKQRAQITNSAITPANSGTWGVAAEGKYNGTGSNTKELYIDEFAVLATEITAAEAFEMYQAISLDTDNEISALMVNPTYSAGYGPTIAAAPMIATAAEGAVFPFVVPLTGQALFQQPNFEATKNTSNAVTAWTASALMEDITFSIGEFNGAQHMEATATFPQPQLFIPGFWFDNPKIATAEMVQPTVVTTLGALIKPQSLNAKAMFALPPAYYLASDDKWYQALLNVDYQTPSVAGKITFFNTNDTIYVGGAYDGWQARQPSAGYNLVNSPLPAAYAGVVDNQGRKALNIRNIELTYTPNESYSGGWTLETMFRTTKKNQYIATGYLLGDTTSSVSRNKRSGIRLKDGKIAFINEKDTSLGYLKSSDSIAFTGYKDIADGEWHHLIIQLRNDGVDANNARLQVWIDGQLDIQRFGLRSYSPNQIGFNSSDVDAYSDFDMSAISINKRSYVLEKEILINYLAAIDVTPIEVPVAKASADFGKETKASGNRGRALMLYFWPTASEQLKGVYTYTNFTSDEAANTLTTMDYYTSPPQEYEGWDVFPVDVTGRFVSELVKPEAYGVENIKLTTFSSYVGPWDGPNTKTYLVNSRGTFVNPVTDAARYIDLINDIDLSQFDMIFFKNYPNDPKEKDAFTGSEIVDAYFNLRESKLFEDFLKSLRAAVDTGVSLMVSSAQLALDLKIVDRVEVVPAMDDNIGQGNYSDPYAPTQMFGIEGAVDLPVPPEYDEPLGWEDTWKNNRTRIVNTHPGITDYPALVKTQFAFWRATDEFRWGAPDRPFARYEHKNALAVGDEFVISTTGGDGNKSTTYLATPFENVKAGKIITAFANTVRRGLDLIDNPYKNYAQSIILEPGDVLDGRQVGGKIYVNFTEEINKVTETGSIELTSDYWVNYAYENGAIDIAARNDLLQQDFVQTETPYWSLNGMHILQQAGAQYELDTDFEKPGVQKKAVKTRKINKAGGLSFTSVPTGGVFFSSTYAWQYPMINFEVPSMPTRGFRWLSNREVLEGTVIRPVSMDATAQMPNALAVPDKGASFRTQSMVAAGYLPETQFSSGTRTIPVLPMTANATIVKPGSTIGVTPMTATTGMFINNRAIVAAEDQVILYLMHVDPILYIREDVIK